MPEHNKAKCAALLFTAPKWDALIYILSLLGSGGEELEILCQRQLKCWLLTCNRSYWALTPEKAKSIISLMDEKARYIDEKTIAHIRFNM